MKGDAEEAELGQHFPSVPRRARGTDRDLYGIPAEQRGPGLPRAPGALPGARGTEREERHLLKRGQHFLQHCNLLMSPSSLPA